MWSLPSSLIAKFTNVVVVQISGEKCGFPIFVVRNSLKFWLYSTSLSLNFNIYFPPKEQEIKQIIYKILRSFSTYDYDQMSVSLLNVTKHKIFLFIIFYGSSVCIFVYMFNIFYIYTN